jgi:hypothetical protein
MALQCDQSAVPLISHNPYTCCTACINFVFYQVTAASKFLTIKESVRDATDLYLSFKHIALAFLCDTPCGFVRHLGCRAKEVTEQLWGKFCGCFEEPSLEKSPATVSH